MPRVKRRLDDAAISAMLDFDHVVSVHKLTTNDARLRAKQIEDARRAWTRCINATGNAARDLSASIVTSNLINPDGLTEAQYLAFRGDLLTPSTPTVGERWWLNPKYLRDC